jgi:(+)-trans-carveol dehydrogenase
MADASQAMNALPIPWMEPTEVSNAVLFPASDEARYITGVTLPVDAGFMLKWHGLRGSSAGPEPGARA